VSFVTHRESECESTFGFLCILRKLQTLIGRYLWKCIDQCMCGVHSFTVLYTVPCFHVYNV
jgi:hypothetical protein